MMAKSFWRHYNINNLTNDYRKVKEESKEAMALEVVTDGKNDKTAKITRNMHTTREHGTGHVFSFVCRLLLC